jgi:hypothetical protein
MVRQRGLSLISTLIVGVVIMAALILGLKVVPVYAEYFAVKKAFSKVISTTDVASPPADFRNAFQRFADVDDITSVDRQSIEVEKDNGHASLHVKYSRTVKIYGPVSLLFEFSVDS